MNRLRDWSRLFSRVASVALGGGDKRRSAVESPGVGRRLQVEPLEDRRVMAAVVEAFTPTASGFKVQFSEEIRAENLNLYDNAAGLLGSADVILTGVNGGNVNGSLVLEGAELTFLATGGVLPEDIYTATLRSAADGIVDAALGDWLDGEFNGVFPSGDGTAGGDFVFEFGVDAAPALVVSLPDFARGPAQDVNVPAIGSGIAPRSGLPINFSQTDGVTSFTLTLTYNPDALDISDITLGPDAPAGSQVEANFDVPGQVTVAFFALEPLAAGSGDLLQLEATVPESAAYGSAHVLSIESLEVNAGLIPAAADAALHVVSFIGDANGNQRYDAEDARLIARVGVGLDSGFAEGAHAAAISQLASIDPLIIGDVTGLDGISPLDASDVLRRVVGLDTPNIPALPSVQAPTALTLSSTSIVEGAAIGTVVGTLVTSDPDAGDTHTYTLVAGDGDNDNASFVISGNSLVANEVFDASVKDSYQIRVRTTDSSGRSLEKSFVITVTEAAAENQAPTAVTIDNDSIADGAAAGTVVGSLGSVDADADDTHSYELVEGEGDTDNGAFEIVDGQLVTTADADAATQDSYSVRVRSTDAGGLSVEQTLLISVIAEAAENQAPTAVTIDNDSIADGAAAGTVVGSLGSVDADADDTHSYELVEGEGDTDNGAFEIVDGQLVTTADADAATQDSYSVRVRSTDAGGLSVEQTLVISVIAEAAENQAPTAVTIDNDSIADGAAAGTVVGSLGSVDADADDTHSYELVEGEGDTDNGAFEIVDGQLVTTADADAATQDSYSVRVRSTDAGGLSVEQTLLISVIAEAAENQAPTAVTIDNDSIADGAAAGTVVGSLGSVDADADDTHSYELVEGEGDTDNGAFEIVDGQLVTTADADAATQDSYSIRVRSTDAGGLSVEQTLLISVIAEAAENQAPTAVTIDNDSIADGAAAGTVVGSLGSVDADADDTHSYELVEGEGDTDNGAFEIVDGQLVTTADADAATQDSYSVRVRSTDAGGLSVEQTLLISVIAEAAENQAPTAVTIDNDSIADGAAAGTVVGSLGSVDADADDTHSYELVEGEGDTDNGAFEIVDGQLVTTADADAATQNSYSVRVRSTDAGGLSVEQTLLISVIAEAAENQAPTAVTIDNDSIADGAAAGTVVGSLGSVDADADDTHSYELVEGEGDTDNGAFEIVDGQLVTTADADAATQDSYSVRVRSTDAGGLSVEQTLLISVIAEVAENQAPTAVTIDNDSIADGAAAGTVVGSLGSVDADADDTHSYELVEGEGDTDNGAFEIVDGQLVTTADADAATQDSYSVRVRSTDAGGLSVEQTLLISVIAEAAENQAPTAVTIDNDSIADGAAAGTVVGSLGSVDADADDTHSYELVEGEGDTDNGAFEIVDGQLVTTADADAATQDSYSVRVRSTDAGGLSVEQTLVISVIAEAAENQAPTAVTIDNDSIADGAAAGTVVGSLGSVDADADDTHSYELVEGEGDTDNGAFEIVDGQLVTTADADAATQDSYSVRVRSTDAGGLSVEQTLVISVIAEAAENQAPTAVTIDNDSIADGAAAGTVVGSLGSVDADADDTHSYELVEGEGDTDNGAFEIVDGQLVTTADADAATQDSYSVRVRSTDAGGLSVEQTLVISVIAEAAENQAPTAVTIDNDSIADGAAAGTVVGSLGSVDADADDTHSYELVEGEGDTDNGAFEIVDGQLVTTADADAATQDSYSVRVRSTDAGGLSVEQTLLISVIAEAAENQAPTAVTIDNDSIADGAAAGTVVGSLGSVDADADDSHSYELVAGEGDIDNGAFEIVDGQLVTTADADAATQDSYSIRVRSTDAGGLSVEQTLLISVIAEAAENQAPTAVTIDNDSIADGAAAGTVVGSLGSVDADADDTHSYELVEGEGDTDNGAFEIVDGQLVTTADADAATQDSYSVRVRSTDAGGLSVEQTLLISVIAEAAENQAPTAVTIDNDSIADGAAAGTVVGSLGSVDADADDTHSYELVEGEGDTDNGAFEIVDGQLVTTADADAATQDSYSVRVRSTDAGGLSVEQTLLISVIAEAAENQAPTAVTIDNDSIADGAAAGTVVGSLGSVDADADDTHSYELVEGEGDTDNGAFEIVDGQLVTTADADAATQDSYSVRVRSTDAGGLSVEQTLLISVIAEAAENQAPTAVTIDNDSIADGAAAGTVVGSLGSVDADADDTHSYELVEGEGDTDNGAFEIVDGQLVTTADADAATQDSYSVRVRSTDAGGLSVEQTLVISVIAEADENQAPTAIVLKNATIPNGTAAGSVISGLGAVDADQEDTHAYSLVAGNGDADNASFEIVDGYLIINVAVDGTVQDTYRIRIRSTDEGGLSIEQQLVLEVTGVEDSSDAAATAAVVQQVVEATNQARELEGVSPLTVNPQLAAAAQAHAEDMALQGKLSHQLVDGKTLAERVQDSGYSYASVSENLASTVSEDVDVVQVWLDSPDHREAIMSAEFVDVGVGTAVGDDGIRYTVQIFGEPALASI